MISILRQHEPDTEQVLRSKHSLGSVQYRLSLTLAVPTSVRIRSLLCLGTTGAQILVTFFEEGTSPLSSPTPKTAPLAPEGQRDSVSRPPKLPVRSHTSPTLGKGAKSSGRQKERLCTRCTNVIEDGRWIQMEGGSVL